MISWSPSRAVGGNAGPWFSYLRGFSGTMKYGAVYLPSTDADTTKLTVPAAAMNLKLWRHTAIDWSRVEKTDSVYNFSDSQLVPVDALATAGVAAGIDMMSTFCLFGSNSIHPTEAAFGPTSGFPAAPTHAKAAYNFAASHLGSKCNMWELQNEPDLGTTPRVDVQSVLQECENMYAQIKAGNPAADVFAYGSADAFAKDVYANAFMSGTGSGGANWTQVTDGISLHSYGAVAQLTVDAPPESLFMRAKRGMDLFIANRPGCRFWLTESGWNNAGGTLNYSEATVGRYLGRYAFLIRTLPGLEAYTHFALYEMSAQNWGLYHDVTAPKTQATSYGDALAVLNHVVSARYYQHATSTVHLVSMRMDDGTDRVCLWGNSWRWATGYVGAQTSVDTAGTVTVRVIASGAGTLTTKTIGGGTSTQPLLGGVQHLAVPYSGTAVVLSANVPITFDGMPPV